MMKESDSIVITKKWLKEIVIGLNFCPFANQPFINDAIRYVELFNDDISMTLETVIRECHHLQENPEIETTLIILNNGYASFNRYLQLIDLSEQLLEKESLSGIFQIASFHPEYIFHGLSINDPANHTNRSPYPMLHILREESIDTAVDKHKDVHSIPENNITQARKLGVDYFKNWLKNS